MFGLTKLNEQQTKSLSHRRVNVFALCELEGTRFSPLTSNLKSVGSSLVEVSKHPFTWVKPDVPIILVFSISTVNATLFTCHNRENGT